MQIPHVQASAVFPDHETWIPESLWKLTPKQKHRICLALYYRIQITPLIFLKERMKRTIIILAYVRKWGKLNQLESKHAKKQEKSFWNVSCSKLGNEINETSFYSLYLIKQTKKKIHLSGDLGACHSNPWPITWHEEFRSSCCVSSRHSVCLWAGALALVSENSVITDASHTCDLSCVRRV